MSFPSPRMGSCAPFLSFFSEAKAAAGQSMQTGKSQQHSECGEWLCRAADLQKADSTGAMICLQEASVNHARTVSLYRRWRSRASVSLSPLLHVAMAVSPRFAHDVSCLYIASESDVAKRAPWHFSVFKLSFGMSQAFAFFRNSRPAHSAEPLSALCVASIALQEASSSFIVRRWRPTSHAGSVPLNSSSWRRWSLRVRLRLPTPPLPMHRRSSLMCG